MNSKKSTSRTRSRGRPRKSKNATVTPTKDDKKSSSPNSTDNASEDEDYIPIRDEMDIEDDNIIQELEESATEHALSTDKNASTPTKTNTTKAQADNGSKNPAQAKVNRALNTITAYRDKLNMLKNRAAEKANEKKEARKARSVKKSQHTQSDDNDASEQDSDSVNDSGNDTDSNDDDKNKNKKTKKTKKSKSTSKAKSTTHDDPNNYYNAMNKKVSDMSKTERKKIKAIQRKNRTYFGLKLKVTASDNPIAELSKRAAIFYTELQKADPKAIIYGFRDDSPIHAIEKPKDIPDALPTIREFFLGAYGRSESGFVWTTVWIGHDLSIKDLLGNLKFWSKLDGTRLYCKALQVKNSVRDYFLLWSTSVMDKDKLQAAVTKKIATFSTKKYSFAFTWIALKDANDDYVRLEKKERNGNTLLKALHIEVPKEERDATYKVMQILFGLGSRHKVLGTNMLMVPVLRPEIPTHKIDNINHLIYKHKQFTDKLVFAKTYDFANIDRKNAEINLSIRDMLMDIKTLDGTYTKVFWSVDYDEKDGGHFLTYPSYLNTQARDIIAQLPSLLHWIYETPVLQMMTASAQERALDAPWDPKEMRAISQEDRELEAMLAHAKKVHAYADPDAETSDSEDEDDEQVEIDLQRRATEEFLFNKASSNDSVISLGTKVSKKDNIDLTNESNTDDDCTMDSDDASHLTNPSPKKKSKNANNTINNEALDTSLYHNMLAYFRDHNIDPTAIGVGVEGNTSTVVDHHMNDAHHDGTDGEPLTQPPHTSVQDREPDPMEADPPGAAEAPGESL